MHVCMGAEKFRKKNDKLLSAADCGFGDLHGDLGTMQKSFLLFRGGRMKNEWIEPYEKGVGIEAAIGGLNIPACIFLPGNTSTSEDMSVALKYAFPEGEEYDQEARAKMTDVKERVYPALFIIIV